MKMKTEKKIKLGNKVTYKMLAEAESQKMRQKRLNENAKEMSELGEKGAALDFATTRCKR